MRRSIVPAAVAAALLAAAPAGAQTPEEGYQQVPGAPVSPPAAPVPPPAAPVENGQGSVPTSEVPPAPAGEVAGEEEAGRTAPVTSAPAGEALPFTGFEAGLAALAAFLLIATGAVLRRQAVQRGDT